MLGVKVRKEDAETTRRILLSKALLLRDYVPIRQGDLVIFPVSEAPDGYEVVDVDFPSRRAKPNSLREALERFLPPEQAESVTKSFDIVGHVAIINIPSELWDLRKDIGKAILEVHKNIRTVAAELGPHQTAFRVQPLEVIAGEPSLLTSYKEHGVELRLELGKLYFSPRLSYERGRIAKQVRPGEFVTTLFAGVGPFPLVIHRFQPNMRGCAIELNPDAFHFLVDNIRRNGAEGKIIPVLGDVRDVIPRMFPHLADRVLMPSPALADDFLDVAINAAKPAGATIHIYSLGPVSDPFSAKEYEIRRYFEERGWATRIVGRRRVRSYSPRMEQAVFDVYVRKQLP